jgi:hypothetical protein
MNLSIISQLARLRRPVHFTQLRYFGMESGEGVTIKELEDAMKSRLSATYTQVNDISGPSTRQTFADK